MPPLSLGVDPICPLALAGPAAPSLLVTAELPLLSVGPLWARVGQPPFFSSKIMTLASNQGTVLVIFLNESNAGFSSVLLSTPLTVLWHFLAGLCKAQG